ncbi:related to monophenol monooxygenase (tyrosinase) [Cephalotrichum gorgonifer]|uniref:Related to monophenol monooxygenase (Tyrosinase) n=1 Tax=Cephalotrichum gorgonifer TaxID=2041049 RepID=A0AAE8N352_9PEZI|nr:related to monophenol monooxygenase (tyrosinase) [Cephalotrichum gorgonifer]
MLPRKIITVIFTTLSVGLMGSPFSRKGKSPLPEKGRCINPSKRRAWHTLPDDQKRTYLDSQRCVMDKPGTMGLPGAKTVYDELASNHQILARSIHSTGAFLPYHRYMLHAHEKTLRECGYDGGLPYWDEPHDAGNFENSDIFDKETGFGTCVKGNSCVADGPFAHRTSSIGPGFNLREHCVSRNLNDTISLWSSQEKVDDCMVYDRYEDLWACLYMVPHRGGHGGVGGTMRDPLGSPADPIFYLHHAWVDKLWFDWQEVDPGSRRHDMGGPNTQTPELGFPELPGSTEEEEERVFGKMPEELRRLEDEGTRGDEGGGKVTLAHVLTSLGVIPDTTVGDVVDTRGGYLCYEYV